MSVDTTRVPDHVKQAIPLHTVADCGSLHEVATKSGIPEDKGAAIEVLAIKEMLEQRDADSKSEVEAGTARSRERNFAQFLRWCVNEDQKADALTKRTNRQERDDWHSRSSWVSLRSKKRADFRDEKAIQRRPRVKVPAETARIILSERREAAIAAGYTS